MNFHDEGRPLSREQARSAKENFALSALHIDLNELRHEAAAGDEAVECDGRHTDPLAVCQDGMLSAGFESALLTWPSTAALPFICGEFISRRACGMPAS